MKNHGLLLCAKKVAGNILQERARDKAKDIWGTIIEFRKQKQEGGHEGCIGVELASY